MYQVSIRGQAYARARGFLRKRPVRVAEAHCVVGKRGQWSGKAQGVLIVLLPPDEVFLLLSIGLIA